MKKLLQLNVTANWGSTGKIAEGIGLAAINHGWESYIAYGRYSNPSQSQLIKVGSKGDVYLHYARHRLLDSEGFGSKRPTKKLIRKIEEIQPDIIHLHNIHDHWLNYPLLFDYLSTIDTPIVWTFHDCWAFTGGCAHFENSDCFKWRNANCSDGCPRGHSKAAKQFQLRKASFEKLGDRLTIVCASKWLENYVRQSVFNNTNAGITTIHNGIPLNTVFLPNSAAKEKLILGVSNVWPKDKGLDDFIKLRKLLPADIKIQLVGLSKQQINTLPEGINAIERTSNVQQLADMYNKASVLVNPTYNDTFPTVNLEALACGTPVVTYRTGGSPEAIDTNAGIVVEKGNVNELADAISFIIDNPEKFSSSSCRKRAEENFDRDIQFGKYIELYNQVLQK